MDTFPLENPALGHPFCYKAKALSGTVAANYLIPLPLNFRYLLNRVAIISTVIASLSGGATIALKEVNPAAPIAAALTTSLTGNNNDITLTANPGAAGNNVSLTLVNPGSTASASVSVTGSAITVNLAYATGAITTTGAQLVALINGNAQAAALVSAANAASNDGTGLVTALSVTSLSGGADWTVIQTIVSGQALSNSDAVGKLQALTLSQASVITGGNSILLAVTAGTATTDLKDVLFEMMVL
jgi:hypothetical protein